MAEFDELLVNDGNRKRDIPFFLRGTAKEFKIQNVFFFYTTNKKKIIIKRRKKQSQMHDNKKEFNLNF